MVVWQSLQKKNSSKAKNSNLDAILPFAAAIELIHCYSLIHDDLPAMDNDEDSQIIKNLEKPTPF